MDHKMSRKKRSQRLILLVLALGMATVVVMLLGKLREGRVFGLMLRDQDRQILRLQLLLQRERESSKAMKAKLEDYRTKNFLLRTQKTELFNKLMEAQTAADHLQKMQNEMEASLEEKQSRIKILTEKDGESNLKVTDLSELLKAKETEVKEVKKQLENLGTNSTEGREANNANEEKSEQNEQTPKEGTWVKFQTNGDGQASYNGQNEKPTISRESKSEINEQSEELRTGEDSEEQEADRGQEIETSQASATVIKEVSKEPKNDQQNLNNVEQKEMVVARDEQEKHATPKGPTTEPEGKERKVARNKNRGKGRKRRTTQRGREYNRHGSVEKSELERERKEIAHGTAKLEVSEDSQIHGSSNSSQGQINSEARTEAREEITSAKDQSEKSENPRNDEANHESKEEADVISEAISKQTDAVTAAAEGEEGSKVREGDSIDKISKEEEREITPAKVQSEKFDNPREDEAKDESMGNVTGALANLNTGEESDSEKQEENDVIIEPNKKFAAAENGEDSKIHGGMETTSTEEQAEEPENRKEDGVKNENANDETRVSADLNTEKESDAEKQDGTLKEAADVSATQIPESTTNTDDGSNEEDTEWQQSRYSLI